MNWNLVLESFVSNLMAAAAIAGTAWAASWVRNHRLEQRLADSIAPNGIGMGFDPVTLAAEFTLQIHNYADATVRVRSIVFVAERFHLELRPRRDRSIYQTPLTNEVLQTKFKRKFLSKGALEEDGNTHAMLLPAKTMGVWEVDPNTLAQHKWKIVKVYMAFEYATLFGNLALIRVEPKPELVQAIRNSLEPLSSALHEKRYADALALFQPPRHHAKPLAQASLEP